MLGQNPILGRLTDRITLSGTDGNVFFESSSFERGAGFGPLVASMLPTTDPAKVVAPASGELTQGDADVTVTTAHSVVLANTNFTASRKVNLPPAADYQGRFLRGKAPANAGTYAQVLVPGGAELINGGAFLSIGVDSQPWTVYSNGSAWFRVGA